MTDTKTPSFELHPIGHVRSSLARREDAPRQGDEGAPAATLVIEPAFRPALRGITVGDTLVLLTWFHASRRDVLEVHPRGEARNPVTGVFATRSPDRPNPIGLHRVRVLALGDGTLEVEPLEAIDGTPIVDLKPVLDATDG